MAATNTIPAGKPPIDAAEDNISQFVDDVLANGAAAVADTFATRVRRELDSDRITFTLVFRLTDGTDVTFEVGMPNRSLAEVNYGARKVDKPCRTSAARAGWAGGTTGACPTNRSPPRGAAVPLSRRVALSTCSRIGRAGGGMTPRSMRCWPNSMAA
jgi:hypothetical protein